MRVIWLIFGVLLLALIGARFYWQPAREAAATQAAPPLPVRLVAQRTNRSAPAATAPTPPDSLVRFALRQLGTPYVYAGTSPGTGFDCSGFLQYVYARFGVATPHSTALLIDAGRPVARAAARPGDIVVFTGTAEGSTTPGHAGIVISALGETPLRFVHASSARRESGVKVSQVEGSGYERRFMQVRRVMGDAANPATLAASPRVVPPPTLAPTKAVAALAPKAATVAAVPMAPLPAKVAPLPPRAKAVHYAKKATATPARHPATKAAAKMKTTKPKATSQPKQQLVSKNKAGAKKSATPAGPKTKKSATVAKKAK